MPPSSRWVTVRKAVNVYTNIHGLIGELSGPRPRPSRSQILSPNRVSGIAALGPFNLVNIVQVRHRMPQLRAWGFGISTLCRLLAFILLHSPHRNAGSRSVFTLEASDYQTVSQGLYAVKTLGQKLSKRIRICRHATFF